LENRKDRGRPPFSRNREEEERGAALRGGPCERKKHKGGQKGSKRASTQTTKRYGGGEFSMGMLLTIRAKCKKTLSGGRGLKLE